MIKIKQNATIKEIKRQIKLLGEKTPKQIHDLLVKKGIRGCAYSSDSCPIAKYVEGFCKNDVKLDEVAQTVITLNCYPDIIEIKPPKNIATFISNFDNLKYPKLRY